MVGLIPLIAVAVLEQEVIARLPGFQKRMRWFLENRRDLAHQISYMQPQNGPDGRLLLAIPSRERLERVLRYMLDEKRVSLALRHPLGFAISSGTSVHARFATASGAAWITSRPNPPQAFSAAIPTGAARSGSR